MSSGEKYILFSDTMGKVLLLLAIACGSSGVILRLAAYWTR